MKKILVMIVAALMIGLTQQVQAQKWLRDLNKGLDAVNKALSSGNNTKSNNSSANYTRESALYKIHRTADTKTITLDGNATFMGYFNEGLCVIGWKKGWFIINKQGRKVFSIAQGYEPCETGNGFIGFESNRLMTYSKQDHKAIIYDGTGKIINEIDSVVRAYGFVDGVALVKKEIKVGKWDTKSFWSYIDVNGNAIPEAMSVTSYDFKLYGLAKNGLARVCDYKNNKWGFRNNRCQWVIQPTFSNVHAFSDDLAAAVDNEGMWGYIDKTGKWAIYPTYSREPGDFNSGLAMVMDKQNKKHFINKTGKIVWSQPANFSGEIREFLDNGYAIWTLDDGIYIIDTSFRKKCRLKIGASERGAADDLLTYNNEWFEWRTSWREDGRLFDWNGNVLLFFNCSYQQTFADGICRARNASYYFNDKGEVIVEFKDTQF